MAAVVGLNAGCLYSQQRQCSRQRKRRAVCGFLGCRIQRHRAVACAVVMALVAAVVVLGVMFGALCDVLFGV